MIVQLFFFLVFPLLGIAQTFRVPAEWEKQEKVWLTWSGFPECDSVTCRIIEALQPHVQISLNIAYDQLKTSAEKYLSTYDINTSKINFVIDGYADIWTRDPVFFVKDEQGKLNVVCFNYSYYGLYPGILAPPIPDNIDMAGKWDERLAQYLNIPAIKSDFVFEGGGIEANGNGTFLIIKEMAVQRNPDRSISEIENELRRTLGAKKIIWLNRGLIEDRQFPKMGPFFRNYFGGGANMHVDELCRFVNDRTVILPCISIEEKSKSPVDSINYEMLEENYSILKQATTAEGDSITIVRIPMPEIEQLKLVLPVNNSNYSAYKKFGFNTGDTVYRLPAASYCNFFVSNGIVLIPKYWKPGMTETQKEKDEEVYKIFKQLLPDSKIIQIYTLSVNRWGGGIHCITHEQPVSKN
jgi:agmatine deiminase